MIRIIRTRDIRRFLVALLLLAPLTLLITTPAHADGIFPFSDKLKPGEEVCLGPTFTEDPATDRVVVLSNSSEPPASAPVQWTINRGTSAAMTDAVAVLQRTGTSVHLLVTPTGFPNQFPGWFNGCIKNTNPRGRPITIPQAYFTVMVPE